MNQTDVELMLRVREGDPVAFSDVMGRHQKPLLNYFYRLTWDRHRSEDLAQEVLAQMDASETQQQVFIECDEHADAGVAIRILDQLREAGVEEVMFASREIP